MKMFDSIKHNLYIYFLPLFLIMRILKTLAKISSRLKPKAYPAYSVASTEKDILKDFEITKEDLEVAYLSNPIVNRALHFRADLIIARGFTLDFSDDKTKRIINEFLHNIKQNSPINADLKTMIRNACIDVDVFGNAYYHLITNKAKNKIVKIAPRHPVNMDFQRDETDKIILDGYGEPIGYVFKSKGTDALKFEREEIAHLIFETIGDELLGIPLLLPMYKTIERLANIEHAIAQSLYKHGLPTRVISVGDADHEPSADDIDKVAEQVKGIDAASEYTKPYWYSVDTIEPKWPTRIQGIPDIYLNGIVSLAGIPKRFLLGEERYATTAQSLQRNLALMLDPLQGRVKSWVEEQIFRPVLDMEKCDGTVDLTWRAVLPQSDPQLVEDTIGLSGVHIEGKPLITWKEAREKLKLPLEIDEEREVSMSILATDKPGLYLVAPHGELIWRGRKRAIVKSVRFTMHIGEPLFLLSDNLCYGVIKLDSPVEINLKEFRELTPKHLVSEEEREEWWPEKKKLYYYPMMVDKLFDTPRKWKYEPGVQIFVKHVEFK